MRFFDAANNTLDESTPVAFPLALGKGVTGNIVKIDSGLGVGGPAAVPRIAVMFVVPLEVAPNGFVGGVFAMPMPQAPQIAP